MLNLPLAENHNTAIEETREIARNVRELTEHFSRAIDKCVPLIERLARESQHYIEQTHFQEAARALKRADNQLAESFRISFCEAIDGNEQHLEVDEESALNFYSNSLCIVTEYEMQYQLRLESSFANAMRAFEGLHFKSEWQFIENRAEHRLHRYVETLRPGTIAGMFQEAIRTHRFSEDQARIVYRIVGTRLFELTADLIGEILPATRRVAQHLRSLQHKPETANPPTEPSAKESAAKVDVTGLLRNWDVPAKLGEHDEEPLVDLDQLTAAKEIREVETEQLHQVLAKLAKQSAMEPEKALDRNQIRAALRESLSQMDSEGILGVIDRVSENTINLVSHLFEEILLNQYLIADVACQISRIQPAVIQLALTDTSLFKDSRHVVRLFLNDLTQLGLKIASKDEEGFRKIEAVVNGLLQQESMGVQQFEAAQRDLETYLRDSCYALFSTHSLVVDQEMQTASSQATLVRFFSNQHQLLEQEFPFHRMSKLIWTVILEQVITRFGVHSREWHQTTDIYSSMLWSTQRTGWQMQHRYSLNALPRLVRGLKRTFSKYGLRRDIADCFVDQLMQIHLQMLRCQGDGEAIESARSELDAFLSLKGDLFESDLPQQALLSDNEQDDADEEDWLARALPNVYEHFDAIGSLADSEDLILLPGDPGYTEEQEEVARQLVDNDAESVIRIQACFDQINALEAGDLIHLIDEQGDVQRYQLAKRSTVLGQFQFSGGESEAALNFYRPELAIEMLRGRITLIRQSNTFDEALGAVVSKIQQH